MLVERGAVGRHRGTLPIADGVPGAVDNRGGRLVLLRERAVAKSAANPISGGGGIDLNELSVRTEANRQRRADPVSAQCRRL